MEKTKKVQHQFGEEIQKDFNIMLGLEDPEPSIVEPLYNTIMDKSSQIISIIKDFYANFSKIGSPSINSAMTAGSVKFASLSKNFCSNGYYSDVGVNTTMLGSADIAKRLEKDRVEDIIKNAMIASDPAILVKKWKEMKEDPFISDIKVLASNIKELLESEKARSHQKNDCFFGEPTDFWLVHAANERAIIFPWSESVNFTQLYNLINTLQISEENKKNCRTAFLKMIKFIYNGALDIHRTHMTPDISAKKFSHNLIKSLMDLKKIDGFSHLTKGFGIIQKSIDLLEQNFPKYYYDVRSSGNPGILIESFVHDVLNSEHTAKSSAVAQSQLKKLMSNLVETIKKNNPNLPSYVESMLKNNRKE
jgi:hypothetical protein